MQTASDRRPEGRGCRALEQILECPLLEVRGQEHRGWRAALEHFGKPARKATLLTFETYYETLRAAEQGLGIAFGLFPLTTEWVLAGRLAVPFPECVPIPGHVALLSRVAEARRPLYREFLAWLRAQFEALPALPDGRIMSTRRQKR
jgi:LysR family transcriptional regulator, glycine cleavage system transcriptional activator